MSSPQKAEIARAAGADIAIDYRRDDVAARVREATEGQGVDRIIEVDIAANAALDLRDHAPRTATAWSTAAAPASSGCRSSR